MLHSIDPTSFPVLMTDSVASESAWRSRETLPPSAVQTQWAIGVTFARAISSSF